jgi:TrmH family RNA methyltransferase
MDDPHLLPARAREAGRLRTVSSRQNALVKELRRAFAHAEGSADSYCAIEGLRIIEEAVRSGARFRAVFFAESARQKADRLLPQISSHAEALVLPDEVFHSAVATETPQGVAALVKLRQFTLEDVLNGSSPLIVVAAGVQDPGNLGTIIRSGEAFGVSGVLLAEHTVAHLNPKAVRASAGSLFRLPVVRMELEEAIRALRDRDIRLLATSSHKGTPLDAADLAQPAAIFIGSEGSGLPRRAMAQMDELIAIPHSERVESLNAGVAASIVLYEAARQRKAAISDKQ